LGVHLPLGWGTVKNSSRKAAGPNQRPVFKSGRQGGGMLKAVSLFSGAGGFCEGVSLAGFKVVCAVEEDKPACRTHSANFADVALFEVILRVFSGMNDREFPAERS
jgi:hypothetical protein